MIKKILVTGSSGMLGSDLMEVLSSHFQVQGISRSSQKESIRLDLTQTEDLRKALHQIRPDVVIHAAAYTKVDACESEIGKKESKKQNFEVVENLIEICNEINALLIFFSTDYVFDGAKIGPYVEDDKIQPINYYGQTKAWAEKVLQQKSERFMIFRVTWLYGKNGRHFPGAILEQALTKSEIPVVNDQRGRPTWTKDVAKTLKGLLEARHEALNQYNKQIFHIGNSGTASWAEVARQVLKYAGKTNVQIREISSSELKRDAKRPANSVLSLDKAKKYLGIEMRSWQEALNEFLKGLK